MKRSRRELSIDMVFIGATLIANFLSSHVLSSKQVYDYLKEW